jgi:hypothetical protein
VGGVIHQDILNGLQHLQDDDHVIAATFTFAVGLGHSDGVHREGPRERYHTSFLLQLFGCYFRNA